MLEVAHISPLREIGMGVVGPDMKRLERMLLGKVETKVGGNWKGKEVSLSRKKKIL